MFLKLFHRNFKSMLYVSLRNVLISNESFCSVICKILISLKNDAKEKFIRMQSNSCYLLSQLRREDTFHFPKRFGSGHILGPMGAADHSFVLINLVSYTQFRMFVMKRTCMKSSKHF